MPEVWNRHDQAITNYPYRVGGYKNAKGRWNRAGEGGALEQEDLSGQGAAWEKAKEQVRTAKALLSEKPANKNTAYLNKITISRKSTKASG
jgi:hypothetical protein